MSEEVPGGPNAIQPIGTSTAAFLGQAPVMDARLNEAVAIDNWSQFLRIYTNETSTGTPLANAVAGYFANGGRRCYVVNIGAEQALRGGAQKRPRGS